MKTSKKIKNIVERPKIYSVVTKEKNILTQQSPTSTYVDPIKFEVC